MLVRRIIHDLSISAAENSSEVKLNICGSVFKHKDTQALIG